MLPLILVVQQQQLTTDTTESQQLPPGRFEVKVAGTNFKTSIVSDVVVAVGQTLPLDVHLEIGGAAETVTVVGQR